MEKQKSRWYYLLGPYFGVNDDWPSVRLDKMAARGIRCQNARMLNRNNSFNYGINGQITGIGTNRSVILGKQRNSSQTCLSGDAKYEKTAGWYRNSMHPSSPSDKVHNGQTQANILYLDFHVRSIPRSELDFHSKANSNAGDCFWTGVL